MPAGGATQWLPIVVGDRRAREILMLCERISPQQALDWGLVNRVVPRSELDATVADLAANLARKLPETIRYTKTQLNWWRELVWGQTIQHARDWLAVHSSADETKEAVDAFHEKRKPRVRRAAAMGSGSGEGPAVDRPLREREFCAGRGLPRAKMHRVPPPEASAAAARACPTRGTSER